MLNGFYNSPKSAKVGNLSPVDLDLDGDGGGGGGGYYPCFGVLCQNGYHRTVINDECVCVLTTPFNPCENINCPSGFQLIYSNGNCVCMSTGSTNPCANVDCQGAQPMVIDGVCHCVSSVEGDTDTVCTADAKVCPNGVTVGRNPNNNCEFFPCPSIPQTVTPQASSNINDAIDKAVAFTKQNPLLVGVGLVTALLLISRK